MQQILKQNTADIRRKSSIDARLLIILCFVTNISQMPIFVRLGNTQELAIPLWILAAAVGLKNKIRINYNAVFYLTSMLVFLIGQVVAALITGGRHLNSANSYSMYLSLFVFMVSFMMSSAVRDKDISNIAMSYIISALIVAFNVYIEYFRDNEDWATGRYAYASKNSVSQIIFTAIVLLLIVVRANNIKMTIFKFGGSAFLFALMIMLRSRATIIGLAPLVIIALCSRSVSKKTKLVIFALTVFSVLFVLFNKEAYELIVNNVLLSNREATDLNAVSSGRFDNLKNILDLFRGNELLGIGYKYFDCFYIAVIVQHGFAFGWIPIIIALWPIAWSVRNMKFFQNRNCLLLLIMSSAYALNGAFECYAPFGPGVKCYFLWMLFGLIINRPLTAAENGVGKKKTVKSEGSLNENC